MMGKAAYLERLYSRVNLFSSAPKTARFEGSTPPSVFVGRHGYPKVDIGPLVPPVLGDTRAYDAPESWIPSGKTAEDIAGFRFQLVRGRTTVDIKDDSRTVQRLRELALQEKPADVDLTLQRAPTGGFVHEEAQPFGPSAPLKDFQADVGAFDPKLEKAHHDTDLKARDAIVELYQNGSHVTDISRALSVASFGLEKTRKLVPTRWSITAVDDTLSLHLLEQVRCLAPVETYSVFEVEGLRNKFLILFYPSLWRYESVEAFFPQVVGDELEIFGDHEEFQGRKTYASIGGCYYSARLAVAERLLAQQRQAGVLILREVYEGYVPLGVWNVREHMRKAMAGTPLEFETWSAALSYALTRLRLPLSTWQPHSAHLHDRATQTSLSAYF